METRLQVTQRKIRNGLRKQAEKIQHEKEKIWEILKRDPNSVDSDLTFTYDYDANVGFHYCPYIPIRGNGLQGVKPIKKTMYVAHKILKGDIA